MTDPIRLLEMPLDVVEPPQELRDELRARLLAELTTSPRRRRSVTAAAAAVAAAAAAVMVVLPGDEQDPSGLVVVAVTPTPQPAADPVPELGPVATPPPASRRPAVLPSPTPAPPPPAGPARAGGRAPARPDLRPDAPPLVTMSYGDPAHDAYAPYRVSNGRPNKGISDPSVDFLEVRFVPHGPRHFTVSATLGAAPKGTTQYFANTRVSADCFVYWNLTPGQRAEWALFCEAGAVDALQQRGEVATDVVVDGATISAEYDMTDRDVVPPAIYDAVVLGPSFSRACPDTGQCTDEATYDEARSPADASFRWR